MSRLEKPEKAFRPKARQQVIFVTIKDAADAQLAARKASGELGDQDNVIVVSWMSEDAAARFCTDAASPRL